jgi:hypothetical protein
VNYSGLILLFGAEFTQVYATQHGRKIVPTEAAESTEGKNENGAIVNKKTESHTKSKRAEAHREASRKTEKREKKIGLKELILGIIIGKIKRRSM